MPCLPQYLQRRGSGIFHFRLVIPVDLRSRFNQREIKRSLATKDPAIALVLAHKLRKTISHAFRECRSMASEKNGPFLKQIIWEISRPDGGKESFKVEHSDPEVEVRMARDLYGQIAGFPATHPRVNKGSQDLLSETFASFAIEREREHAWTLKTKEDYESTIALLIEILGDIPVGSIDSTHVRAFKDALLKLPPNMNKDPRYKGKSVQDLMELGGVKAISNQTINKRISRVSGLLNWAVLHGLLHVNPFKGVGLKIKERPDEQRKTFSEDDLVKLFSSEIFTSGKFKRAHYYWIPILGLYTGGRIDELCQLYLDDIRQEEGIWVLDLNEANDKKLKNTPSKRLIPVHKELIRLGFLEFVESQRRARHVRLFPQLKKERDGYSQAAQKWFNARYRKSQGITDPKKSFHSFRHTLVDRLKQGGIDPLKIGAIVGHADDSMTTGRYGKRHSPSVLQEAIDSLSFAISLNKFDW